MVSTLDFESSDPSSNLGGTYPIKHGLIPVFIYFFFFVVATLHPGLIKIFILPISLSSLR